MLVVTWAGRVPYAYDLEWMEGGMLAHGWRMRQELPLYPEPGPDWAPYIYPPGYPAIVAGLGSFVPLHPALGRVVSLLGTAMAALSLAHVLRRRGASIGWAFGLTACFVGTYPASGAFFDLVRPDGVSIGLVGLSVALALDGRRGTSTAAGLVLASAFLVKHNAAAFGVPLFVGLLLRHRRDAFSFALASLGPALSMVGYLHWRTGGRFLVYLLEVPASHPSIWARFWPGTVQELGAALAVLTSAGALWLVLDLAKRSRLPVPLTTVLPVGLGMGAVSTAGFVAASPEVGDSLLLAGVAAFGVGALAGWALLRGVGLRRRPVSPDDVLVVGVLLTAFVMAGVMRAHNGGYLNVHLPLFWAACLAFGWVTAGAEGPVRWAVPAQLLLAIGGGLTLDLMPTPKAREAGDQLVEALRGGEGPVLSPFAAWLPTYAGHPPSVHYMALWDLDYEGGPFEHHLDEVREAVEAQRWPQAVRATRAFPYGLDKAYEPRGQVDVGDVMQPATGWGVGPKAVLQPR